MENFAEKNLPAQLLPFFSKYSRKLVAVYLFGSAADGTATDSSDIDIAVLLRNTGNQEETFLRFNLYADLCRTLGRNDIDLVILNYTSNLILKDTIIRHGIVLYTADDSDNERIDFELKVMHSCTDFKLQRHRVMGI